VEGILAPKIIPYGSKLLKVATLLSKPTALIHPIKIDYCCFDFDVAPMELLWCNSNEAVYQKHDFFK
jgi:hypothetical protein